MTLRWAKRSKEYFEAHKREVPWHELPPKQNQLGWGTRFTDFFC
jgi:hypothetical protein